MFMPHRLLLFLAVLPLLFASRLAADDSLLLVSRNEARAIKQAMARKSPSVTGLAERLRAAADRRIQAGPWSVTFHRPKSSAPGPHDYYSDAPYWWPDPANPSGPYIRKDGEHNPDRFIDHRRDVAEMSDAVLALGLAAWMLDEPRYADRAARLISVWFLDQATRMTPHLEFGQAIRNVNSGRGSGIIDTASLIWAVQGMMFLAETGRWKPSEQQAVRQWFADYLRWLTESKKGLEEKSAGNNHSNWWAAQVAAYAVFTGDAALQRLVWEVYRANLAQQMQPDGSCPREEQRTKSLGYSAMNLSAFALICRMAEKQGLDLWHFRGPNGAGIGTGVAYLAPHVMNPAKWGKPQIVEFDNDRCYFLALAGMGLGKPEYIALWRRMDKAEDPRLLWIDLLPTGWKQPGAGLH
jgi:hypothetical protein